ncbi:MAG: heat shock protein GrpE, partial [Gammaproteobacteria bacterium]|nr:heat shock protein GrpE [Gammaproteobacteria bacterium]
MSNDKQQKSNLKQSGSSADAIASLLDEDTLRFGDEAPLTPQEPGTESAAEPAALSEEHRTLKATFDDQIRTQQATIASLEESLSRAKEAVLRAQAETANAHRRAEKTIADAHKYALEKFAKQLLDVVDSLERALEVDLSAAAEPGVK